MWRASRITTKLRCNSGSRCRLSTKPEEPAKPAAAPQMAPQATPPPPPPPPPPKKGGIGSLLVKLLGVGVVGSGAVIGVSWYDPKFRESLLTNVPYASEVLPYVFQYLPDNSAKSKPGYLPVKTPSKEPEPIVKSDKQSAAAPVLPVPAPPMEEKPAASPAAKDETVAKTVPEIAAPPKADTVPPAQVAVVLSEEDEKKQKQQEIDRLLHQKEADEAAEIAAMESIVKDMLQEVSIATGDAIAAENSAAKAIQQHSGLLRTAMEEDSQNIEQQWEAVASAYEDRIKSVNTAKEITNHAIMSMEKLKSTIHEGKDSKVTSKTEVLLEAQQLLGKLTYDLNTAMAEHKKQETESKLMSDYKNLVEKGKEQFQKEMASIMPDVQIGRKGIKLSEEELNSLIAHAHRRIEQLQRQLAEQQALEQQRTTHALDRQREADKAMANDLVNREMDKIKNQFDVQKDIMEKELNIHFESELRHQLMRQAAAHSDHIAEVLKVQQGELQEKFEEVLRERLVKERDQYHIQVASWVARLKGIESAVDGRAEMEKEGRKAQELWLATQSLQTLIKKGRMSDPEEWEDQLIPLSKEFEAVKQAAGDHPYVTTVIESVPAEALERGVWTEEALQDRYNKVRRVCRRVAMIGDTGAPLYKYLLSYFQSFFIFSAARPLGDNEEVDSSKLTTFVLVDNARSCLEKGDLEQAVRYINQLEGLPRKMASDWLKEAILLLETRQAADALLAYASATGLGALF